MVRAFWWIWRKHRVWWRPSDRSRAERKPWRKGFGPGRNPVYARNLIVIRRTPAQVFQKLMLAEQWPQWYENSADVVIHRPSTPTGRFAREGVPEARVTERVGAASEAPGSERDGIGSPTAQAHVSGEGVAPMLGPGVEFSWRTFGVRVRSEVTEFEPDEMIGWTARGPGMRIYHRWFFKADASGTLVITEECEKGPVIWIARWFMNRALHAGHQLWLESLRKP